MGEHSMSNAGGDFDGAAAENASYFQGEKNERTMIVAFLRTLADEAEKDGNPWPGTRAACLRMAAGLVERVEHPTWLNRKRGPKP
jgi:hypothetical protein